MSDLNNNDNKQKDNKVKSKSLYRSETKGHENAKIPLWFVKSRNTINYILGVVEVLLAFRFVFKLLGANPHNEFVAFLYSITDIFTAPFSGIFNSFVVNGLAARSVFEPATIIGMIVYAVVAWGLKELILLKVNRDGY
ncbi:MAG: YggT family protein [Bacillota bacterium]